MWERNDGTMAEMVALDFISTIAYRSHGRPTEFEIGREGWPRAGKAHKEQHGEAEYALHRNESKL